MSDRAIDWIAKADEMTFRVQDFVGGRWCRGGGVSREKYSPRDGKLLYRFETTEARNVDAAVAIARQAFADGRWSRLSVQRRKEALCQLSLSMKEHAEELALLECLDVGKPISEASDFDVPAAAAIVSFNAEAADKYFGKVYAADEFNLSYELRRPIGVVAGIVGWNFPLVLLATKIAPVLAMGNSVVLKPSELTSLSAARIAELAVEAGIPEGVFNVIHGDASVGEALALHRDVDLITFTGSTHTGKKLLVAAGQSNMKRLVLECGGKAPNIVFEDCPSLDAVADGIVTRAFWNQGQVCTASSRILVQESIKNDLLQRIIRRTDTLGFGDPLHSETRFGAVVSREHRQKVLGYINKGAADGAQIVYQSRIRAPYEGGFYVPPVIFDGVACKHKIAREEIFGPVLSVISFRDEAEAIRIANDTIYGLSAILWTKDIARAHRVTQSIDAGWLVVNATERPTGGPSEGVLPVGGHKESGMGIEGGVEGLAAYTTQTSVQLFV